MTRPPIDRRSFCTGLVAALLLLAGAGGCRRPASAGREGRRSTRAEIDLASVIGPLDRLSGVQGSPYPILPEEPDYIEQFRAVGVARARIDQDCLPNTLTLGGIFPDEDADPTLASSYRFAAIDAHLRAARAAGCDVLWQASYDVGGSDRWVGANLGGRPPADVERYCQVVERCLAHFVSGWADGLDGAVRWVEFLNEPNGLGGFTGPGAARFTPLFLRFLETVERFAAAHPDRPMSAVGPGIPLSLAEWPALRDAFERGVAALQAAGRRLPVFSFHTYGADVSPVANARLARELRAMLDAHGLQDTELWNTEWQAGDFLATHLGVDRARGHEASLGQRRAFASGLAAYAVACKLRWQGVVDGSFYYRANQRAFPPSHPALADPTGPTRYFARDGSLGALALHEALMRLAARTAPQRCRTAWDDDGLLTVLGLTTRDRGTAALIASNLDPAPRRLIARFAGLPRDGANTAEIVRLGAETRALRAEPFATATATAATVELAIDLDPLSSCLIVAKLAA